jgi:hypothetical protein
MEERVIEINPDLPSVAFARFVSSHRGSEDAEERREQKCDWFYRLPNRRDSGWRPVHEVAQKNTKRKHELLRVPARDVALRISALSEPLCDLKVPGE